MSPQSALGKQTMTARNEIFSMGVTSERLGKAHTQKTIRMHGGVNVSTECDGESVPWAVGTEDHGTSQVQCRTKNATASLQHDTASRASCKSPSDSTKITRSSVYNWQLNLKLEFAASRTPGIARRIAAARLLIRRSNKRREKTRSCAIPGWTQVVDTPSWSRTSDNVPHKKLAIVRHFPPATPTSHKRTRVASTHKCQTRCGCQRRRQKYGCPDGARERQRGHRRTHRRLQHNPPCSANAKSNPTMHKSLQHLGSTRDQGDWTIVVWIGGVSALEHWFSTAPHPLGKRGCRS